MLDSAVLSLRQLEEFDPRAPQGGTERRFLCPLCGEGKPKDSAHRSLGLNTQSGAWLCHRCGEKGKLAEWEDEEPLSGKALRRRKLRRAFSLESEVSARADTSKVRLNSGVLSPAIKPSAPTPSLVCAMRAYEARRKTDPVEDR